MSEYPAFLASELAPRPADQALFHIIPAPYEASVSYGGGTANGPLHILKASDQLELWDGSSIPADLGIYTHPPVAVDGDAATVLTAIEHSVNTALDVQALPVILGGEHTVSFGALKALHERFGRFGLVQFDAHADLRQSYEGSLWSHACVMRRAVEMLGLPLVQFGVRALSFEEQSYRKEQGITAYDAADLARNGSPDILLPEDFPETIYISFDIDALDPSIMPATGTPVPGGLGWYDSLELAARVIRGRRVIGFDLVEFAPIKGLHAPDFTAARLVYALMGLVQRLSRR